MKKLSVIVTGLILAAGIIKGVKAKDNESSKHQLEISIQEMALVDLASSGSGSSINLNPATPSEAGLAVDFTNAVNSDLWLNYSSIIKKNKSRTISAAITGNLPGGTTISVEAAESAGNGYGALGTVKSVAQVLTNKDAVIISDIGSCFTGEGSNQGSNLTYRLNMDERSYENLLKGNYSVVITYTISEK